MRVKCTESDLYDGTMGGCTACGELTFGVEPDACGYECESCGKPRVYGLEELAIMGLLDIEDYDECDETTL